MSQTHLLRRARRYGIGDIGFSVAVPVGASNIVTDWVAQVVINGGAEPSTATQYALAVFVASLSSSSILNKMESVCCFVPDNLIASITPLLTGMGLNPFTNHNFVSGDLSVAGLKGNGSNKYLSLGVYPPNVMANIGVTLYMPDLASTPGSSYEEFGLINSSNSLNNLLLAPAFASVAYWESCGSGTSAVSAASTLSGYFSGNRVSSTDSKLFFANSTHAHAQIGSTATGAAQAPLAGLPFLFATTNISAPNPDFVSGRTISFFAWHQGLTLAQSALFYASIQALRTNLGGGFA